MLTLDQAAEFDPARDGEFFEALPPRAGVYRIEFRAEDARPYLRSTSDIRRSCRRLLALPKTPGDAAVGESRPGSHPRLNLRDVAGGVRYRLTASAFEQSLTLYQQARGLFPQSYRERLRLAPPALLKINLSKEYPRCYVTQRVAGDGAFYFGPFPGRHAAEEFAQEFLGIFKLRRCHIPIRRDPEFPGCIYSEMKMCLAPCYAGCTKPEYDAEVARVTGFLASRGGSLISEVEAERDRAAATEDFESAAAIHKKREKISALLRRLPELPRQVGLLDAIVLQPAVAAGSVLAFRVQGAAIDDPFLLDFRELSSMPRSVEMILRDYLENQAPAARPDERPADSLSLLARWFYAKPRSGEILFRETTPGKGWPYRQILRACARLLTRQESFPAGSSGARVAGDAT
ncbi:MAG TPA: hypothetical protein VNJ12_02640 [Candidatus Dormibacteraeota bacterium]|nr:hypothetical protein [Candidatus Dormibacteraeota bacterium]